MWRNPETLSIPQVVDAAVKMRRALSVPVEFCWEMIGWSQQQILQAKKMMGLPESPAERQAAANPMAAALGGALTNPRQSENPAVTQKPVTPGGVVLPR